jgi:hypothetical protein
MRRALIPACLCLAIWAGMAGAQAPMMNTGLALLGGLEPGDKVRLELLDMSSVEGELVGAHRDTLVLVTDRGEPRVPVSSIRQLWVGGRSVKPYARSGAILGAALGGLSFGLLAPALAAIGDNGDAFTGTDEAAAILLGGALGGLSVGSAGAVIGAAVPRWNLRYQSPAAMSATPRRSGTSPPVPAGASRSDSLAANSGASAKGPGPGGGSAILPERGGIGFDFGLHRGMGSVPPGANPYLQFVIAAQFSRRMTLGVETGTSLGEHTQTYRYIAEIDGTTRSYTYRYPVTHLALNTRVAFDRGPWTPYVVASLGLYTWDFWYSGYSIGMGLRRPLPGPLRLVRFEVRLHGHVRGNPGESDLTSSPHFLTVTAGVQPLAW